MLTPVEIQSKSFKSGGLGYDKKDVDGFMREVLKNYEELYRENMELSDKLSVMNDAIQNYKAMEKTLQKALVLAQKTADETRNAAREDAKRVEAEAKLKANLIISDAKQDLIALHNQTVALIQQYEKYKVQFKNLAKSQFELLNSDAFSINVANLDAFSEKNFNEIQEKYNQDSNKTSYDAASNSVKETTLSQNKNAYRENALNKTNNSYQENSPVNDKNAYQNVNSFQNKQSIKEKETVKQESEAPDNTFKISQELEGVVADSHVQYEDYDITDFEIEDQEEFEIIDLADDDE